VRRRLVEVPATALFNRTITSTSAEGRDPLRRESRTGVVRRSMEPIWILRKRITKPTGPEIWARTAAKIEGVIARSATGGTLAGVSSYHEGKEQGES